MSDPLRQMTWTALLFAPPITTANARDALAALAGISGQPRIVLEATGQGGKVAWQLGCEVWAKSRVLDALTTQVPGLHTDELPTTFDGLNSVMAASVRFRARTTTPLNHGASEQVVRGILGALARTAKTERLTVQLILGPRHRPTRPRTDSEESPTQRRDASDKLREYRFSCEVRIAATAAVPARTTSLIQTVVGAFRSLEAPGIHIVARKTSTRGVDHARSPLLWSNHLGISELAPLTSWPIASDRTVRLPGVPSPHPHRLAPPAGVPRLGRALGMAVDPVGRPRRDRPVALGVEDSLRHLHVLGPTGVGKSTLLAGLALQDITAGRGVVVVDPKGDLVDDILARIPESRADDVVVLDARDQSPVGINALANPSDPDLTADVLLGMFHSLYADAWGPRTHDVLQACLLTLARRGDASVAMVPLLMTNPGFRPDFGHLRGTSWDASR